MKYKFRVINERKGGSMLFPPQNKVKMASNCPHTVQKPQRLPHVEVDELYFDIYSYIFYFENSGKLSFNVF